MCFAKKKSVKDIDTSLVVQRDLDKKKMKVLIGKVNVPPSSPMV